MHLDHLPELVEREVGERAGIADAGVVHDDVEPAEGVHGHVDDAGGLLRIGDVGVARHRFAAVGIDLLDDVVRGSLRPARAVELAPEVGDDDLRAPLGQEQANAPDPCRVRLR